WYYVVRDTPEKVEALLAQASTEQRRTEMRWPRAAWGPVRIPRGPDDSSFSRPKSLIKAAGIIVDHESGNRTDPRWLRLKAQVDIVDRAPEAAIASLNKALEAQPDSVPVLVDLGIAYDLQAEISDDPHNLEQAIDFFGKALSRESTNRAALYNRALLYGRTG